MMNAPTPKPRWWLAYTLFLLLAALLALIERLALAPGRKEIAQIASVLLTFTLLACWVWANAHALHDTEWQQRKRPEHFPPALGLTPRQRHFRRVMRFHPLAYHPSAEKEDGFKSPSTPAS
jgi:hypothetical protein